MDTIEVVLAAQPSRWKHFSLLFLNLLIHAESCSDVKYCVFFFSQMLSYGSEGPGQILIQTVKLAFSVTNNVIRLKPPSDAVSPLEQALTQHGGHGNNLIVVLAKYIYHKHDPALPRLAIQLLKRLATVRFCCVTAGLIILRWGAKFLNFASSGRSHVSLRLPWQRCRSNQGCVPHSTAKQDRRHEDQGHDSGVSHGCCGNAAWPH